MSLRALALTLLLALGAAAPAGAQTTSLTTPARVDIPPPGHVRTAAQVIRIAERTMRAERAKHRPSYSRAFVAPRGRWQVSFFVPPPPGSTGDSEEIAQVIVSDRTGRVLERWTGPQVAWTMARGVPGAFGQAANAPWVWIGLCLLFALPFARAPLRMLHLDLAVLLALSISYVFFGAADLDVSVPSAYPPLVYLLARMLWIGFRSPRPPRHRPLALAVPDGFLLLGLVFLLGFRIVLNVTNGNVIDVGYAGVIGGDHLLHGHSLYGAFPRDNSHGDTYGPVNYALYAPFVGAFPWSGTWNDLPAAHAAVVAFDLACVAGMWLAGARLGGRRLALLFAYLWVACPFTLLVENSGANDGLVAALVLAAFLCLRRPAARGAVVVLAGLAKFAALGLVPLFVTADHRRGRALLAAVLTGATIMLPVALSHGGLSLFWDRTLGFQAARDSPFSIWGLYGGLGGLQAAVTVAAAALAFAVAFVPRRRDEVTIAALGAAVLIALQLAVDHWFYLYVLWFLPLLLIAVVTPAAAAAPARSPVPGARARSGSAPR